LLATRPRLPWEKTPEMIAEAFRRCVCFIYRQRDGEEHRTPWGTAFFVTYPGNGAIPAPTFYAVTAGHVVSPVDGNGNPHSLYFRWPHKAGQPDEFELIDTDDWDRDPGSDLAIKQVDELPIVPNRAATDGYYPVVVTQLYTGADPALPVGEGDSVFAVGLFSPHPGESRPQPIYRFGHISLMPREPVSVLLPDKVRKNIDAFLAEVHSWGGQSGSPVFLSDTHGHLHNQPPLELGPFTPTVIGFVQGHFDIDRLAKMEQWAEAEEAGYDVAVEEFAGVKVPINAGMAIVVPAERIVKMLNKNDYAVERARRAARADEARPAGTPDSAEDTTGGGEFEAFDALASKLVQVPKSEIDERRAKE
jgi:hypothetical protein